MPGPMRGNGMTTESAKNFKGTTKKLIKNYLVFNFSSLWYKIYESMFRMLKNEDNYGKLQ